MWQVVPKRGFDFPLSFETLLEMGERVASFPNRMGPTWRMPHPSSRSGHLASPEGCCATW